MTISRWLILLILTLAPAAAARAQFTPQLPGLGTSRQFNDSRDQVKVSVVPDRTRISVGERLRIAVIFDHAQSWHIQSPSPRDPDLIPTQIKLFEHDAARLTPRIDFLQWPPLHMGKFGGGAIESEVFDGKAVAFLPVLIPGEAPLGAASLTLHLTFQACDETACLAPAFDVPFQLQLEIVAPAEAQSTAEIDAAVFGEFQETVWDRIARGERGAQKVAFDLFGHQFSIDAAGAGLLLLLLVAAFGGFLLNLTPCVLPVIPIKIMSLSMHAGHRGRTLALGLSMFLGVIGFWMILGCAIAFLSGFTATNQLFQYPAFTIGVGVIIILMAVAMCGVFAIRLPQAVYSFSPRQDTLLGSFLFGIMTAVLSTPCTAPFMGAAAAWAATQSPVTTLATFGAIGFGMGVPYFILSAFPALVERMPRTGPASELIKQVMGLLMLAAGTFFLGIGVSGLMVSPPDPPSRLYLWGVAVFGIMAGLWLAWRSIRIARTTGRRALFGGVGLVIACLSLGLGVRLTDKGPINWIYYTPQRFADATSAGRIVVLEFTAEWCANCKFLEETVLRPARVSSLLNQPHVAPIKIDLTGNNEDGNTMLRQSGRLTIPLLIVFAPDGREIFKHDFYTQQQVIDAVEQARSATQPALTSTTTSPTLR